MGFANSWLNVLFNPVGIFEEAGKAMKGKGSDNGASAPLPMPAAPNTGDAAAKAQEVINKKRAAVSQSIYTSPLGSSGEASVVRKTLLGQ
jgi:hypothetical protein